MFRNKSVSVHNFAMVPRADIPRSAFVMEKAVKTTFDSGYLIPLLCEEVLPGDVFHVNTTIFARLATPLVPFMDNLHFDSFFFFVPARLVWENWQKFMGERDNPDDSINYTVPYISSPISGFAVGGIYDQFGLPTVGQVAVGEAVEVNALPLRAYNLIYKEWFRDENLQNSPPIHKGDGPDPAADYVLLRRGKRHDYFTSALPFVQKGTAISVPLTGDAVVKTAGTELFTGVQTPTSWRMGDGTPGSANLALQMTGASIGGSGMGKSTTATAGAPPENQNYYPTNLYADLSTATATTINALRQSFQIQKLLERDARGGTRYTEIVRSHFGVVSPDARLQRPEYLGGGTQAVSINPIAQTSATGVSGSSTPLGELSAFGTLLAQGHGFSQSFVEHGYIIALGNVRADLTYQQGLRKLWTRQTRYDFYFPVFAMLGEQAILNREIYCDGSANDISVFGYQERWAEYRYNPSEIRGLMKSTSAGTIDYWHLAQEFTFLPVLNATFIEDNPPIGRVVATPDEPEFIADMFFQMRVARPLPMYSVPGLVDHF